MLIFFKGLTHKEVQYFLEVLFQSRTDLCSLQESLHLKEAISLGQQFIREAAVWRVEASIRDIMRVIKLYKYFRTNQAGMEILGDEYSHWRALVISIAMGYYFRLGTDTAYSRDRFGDRMDDLMER